MASRIALFNHKGGVSKTTTTFNLGWKLAEKGKSVLMVDADPQCNLTGLVMGLQQHGDFEGFYQTEPMRNLKAGVAPAFESRPTLIKAVDPVPVEGREHLFLLPGHIALSEYEVTLGIAQELSASIQTLQNLPGAVPFLLEATADTIAADYVLIDMNPSLSSINQNLLMTSDYFLVPTSPDYFSVMALNSLAVVLPKWRTWAAGASASPTLRDADYPFPVSVPRFLGIVIQNFRPRGGEPAAAFGKWVQALKDAVRSTLAPKLQEAEMMLPPDAYGAAGADESLCLATIPDFNSLIAASQQERTPVFALTPEQIGRTGVVLEQTIKSRNQFDELFSGLADKILALTGNAPN
jgi:cellulose biosynthesis protein BcsQ